MANQELKGKYPVSKRTFTDVIFCIVFICFSAFSIVGDSLVHAGHVFEAGG